MELIVSVRAENLLARLLGMPDTMRKSLLIAMQRLAIEVQRSVKQDKLSGQVLNVRTGTLRRSINQEVTDHAKGIFAIVGTNVKYAAIHEYGFSGAVEVRGHMRRIRARSRVSPNTGKIVKGKLSGEAFVSPHQRVVVMPQRSFLRSTLRDYGPRIRQQLKEAAREALNK